MASKNKGIYFTELKLKNVRCFGDEAVLKLSNDNGKWSRWNVILGDNATGKTTLLQCLAGMETIPSPFKDKENRVSKFYRNHKRYSFSRLQTTETSKEVEVNAILVNNNSGKTVEIGFGQTEKLKYVSKLLPAPNEELSDFFVIGYGANRAMSFNQLSEIEFENSETLFSEDAKLVNAEEWLLQMDYAASKDSAIKATAKSKRDQIIEILKSILPDISEIKFTTPTEKNIIPKVEFLTLYGWVGIHELSLGYKTMVAWIVDLAFRMFEKYTKSSHPLNEPVTILVDEVDLHLHPKWQRQIFEFLETRFPKAQFVVTAHSPLIVQSAPKDANIVVLRKEKVGEEYIVKIDNDIESVRTWRIDQIMQSDLFGFESARNSEIEAQMKERTKLLQKSELTQEEKKRLDELNEISYSLPTADNPTDIKAMEVIREAAAFLKSKQKRNGADQK